MGKKIIFITIISVITVITIITVIKFPWRESRLVSPLPASGEKSEAVVSSPAEEKTYQTVSYYITTSQQFLNKARELAEQTSWAPSGAASAESSKAAGGETGGMAGGATGEGVSVESSGTTSGVESAELSGTTSEAAEETTLGKSVAGGASEKTSETGNEAEGGNLAGATEGASSKQAGQTADERKSFPRQQTPEEKQKIIELINQALDVINQGIAAYPLDDRVFAQRAAIYQALTPIFPEARNLAIQDLKESIKLNNQNPNYHTQLAQLYLTGGDFEGAALSFYNAHLLAPTDLQILYNLADTLEKGGQLTKAAFWFEKLLGLLPNNDQNQEKIRQRLTALKEAITKANLKYLTSPGELALPAASSKEKEIIGTQELPLEQAALASKIIIAGEKEANNTGQASAEISLNALSGEGVIPSGQTEITIYNNNVEATSKIVVVPLEGDFKNRVLFVTAKKASDQECQYKDTPGVSRCGWFKVGVDAPPKDGIKFKWWIVK